MREWRGGAAGALALEPAATWCPAAVPAGLSRAQVRAAVLGLTLVLALGFRLAGLGAYGYSEDEINKLHAIERYSALDFSANAEHPMLMKLAMLGSTRAAAAVNHVVGETAISAEAALRAPNAIAGALTTLVIFLLVELMFDWPTASWAALLWALDVNATAVNRIGKEDTFLLAFFLLGAWLYERGKHQGRTDPRGAQRWYQRSGAAFGLMMASKYMPHYFGLYALFNRASDPKPGANRPDKRRFYLALGAAFLAVNFTVFLPATWSYVAHYVDGDTVIHHGYVFAHQLYANNVSDSPGGQPVYFYAVYLLTKVPLAVLAAFAFGLWQLVARRKERGFVFLRVFLVFVLVPYSLVAAKFVRYMLPVFAVIDIIAAVGVVTVLRWLETARIPRSLRCTAAGAIVALAAIGPLAAQVGAAPYYSLYENAAGSVAAADGPLFPTDELYDLGLREAVDAVAAEAGPGAVVASDGSSVVAEYLDEFGRRDLRATSLSRDGLPMSPVETWVLVQDGHIYFENQAIVARLRATVAPWRRVRVRGTTAVEIYRLPRR